MSHKVNINSTGEFVGVVQAQLEAYNARDLNAFMKCYHNDVEIYALSEMEPVIKGASEMREKYGEMFRDCPDLHCDLRSRLEFGSFVIDEEFVTGQRKFPEGTHIGAIYQVVDRTIRTVWFTR